MPDQIEATGVVVREEAAIQESKASLRGELLWPGQYGFLLERLE
jgi:hypothetical protein